MDPHAVAAADGFPWLQILGLDARPADAQAAVVASEPRGRVVGMVLGDDRLSVRS